jgi:hypothetical protein
MKNDIAKTGCFEGTLAELAEANEKTHADNPQYLEEYRATIEYFRCIQKARGFA